MRLKKERNKDCGKNEYIVQCRFCKKKHFMFDSDLWIFEVLGFYICPSCAEQMKGYKLVKEEHLKFLIEGCYTSELVYDDPKLEEIEKEYEIKI